MKTLLLAEKIFTVFSLVIFTEGIFQLMYELRTGQYSGTSLEGNIDVIVAFTVIYIITIILLILRWKKVIYLVSQKKLLLFLVGLALASVIWSAAPSITIRRSVALLGTTLFGVYLATRYSLKEQFRLLLWTYGTAMVLSILFCVCFPTYGIHQGPLWTGLWRGIYTHKNTLGRNMGFSLCLFLLYAIWARSDRRWIGWIGVFLAVVLTGLSGSITPVFTTCVIVTILPLFSILRWRYSLTTLVFLMVGTALILVGSLLIAQVATLVGAFGRDLTFTGRSELWLAVLAAIAKRPWLGYGYSGFWLDSVSEAKQVWLAIPWKPDFSHNGYLELALQLGLLGVVIFGIDYVLNFYRCVTLAAATKDPSGIFPLMFLTFLIPYNVTDSIILRQNSILWVLYVSITLSMLNNPIKVKVAFPE